MLDNPGIGDKENVWSFARGQGADKVLFVSIQIFFDEGLDKNVAFGRFGKTVHYVLKNSPAVYRRPEFQFAFPPDGSGPEAEDNNENEKSDDSYRAADDEDLVSADGRH